WGVCWAVAVAAALRLRLPRRRALLLIVGAGLALRVAALAGPPITSDDLFRYSWDGRVQAQGVDPYAQPPASASLGALREPWLWPTPAGCAARHRPPGCTLINRPAVRTIYPPVAEGWFAAVYRVGGISARHKAWQVAGLLTEAAVLALLPLAIKRHGRDPRWVVLYALCPAPVIELVNNGHVDGLAIALMVASLVVVAAPTPGSGRLGPVARDVVFGALVGAAAGVKLYPAVLMLALVGAARPERLASWLRSAAAAATVLALAYLPHVVAVGWRVLGYLPGYLREEKYDQGGRFLVAGALRVPAHLAGPVSALALVAAVAFVLWRRPPVAQAACLLLGVVLLATSPVQPWYAVSLLAMATVAARPVWAVVVVAGYPYFWAVILNQGHTTEVGQLAYTAAAVVVAVVAVATWVLSRGRQDAPCSTPNRADLLGFNRGDRGGDDGAGSERRRTGAGRGGAVARGQTTR
ncbi:MAG: glycosyltransferase 87 family protein, partial [Actinomycetota bacterium]|nr:glycosyltransferase 87 family protein [Actinomycetota bacterium]